MSWRVLQSQDKLPRRDSDSGLVLYSYMVCMHARTHICMWCAYLCMHVWRPELILGLSLSLCLSTSLSLPLSVSLFLPLCLSPCVCVSVCVCGACVFVCMCAHLCWREYSCMWRPDTDDGNHLLYFYLSHRGRAS